MRSRTHYRCARGHRWLIGEAATQLAGQGPTRSCPECGAPAEPCGGEPDGTEAGATATADLGDAPTPRPEGPPSAGPVASTIVGSRMVEGGRSVWGARGDDRDLLEVLAEEFLERRRGGERPSVEEYVARCPDRAAEVREFFSALVFVEDLKPKPDDVIAPSLGGPAAGEATAPERLGEYRVLREVGRGGMGIVYEAEQESLGRRVALKVMSAGQANDGRRARRFLLEAAVIGHLEHPGVVPVHALGRDDAGRPFYAMRLVRGETLQAAIEAYHGAAGGPSSRPMELRHLLRRLLDACNAVAYAHDKGVLHRDLKPENILLGPFGETLVVDWGLAKPFGPESATDGGDEAQLFQVAGSGEETLPGQIMGTPRYMSPEQAAGRTGAVGPRSDVYGLGASLYVLLVGRSAFTGLDLSTMLERVKKGEFPPPRQVRHDVPKALEAICLKAMALRPEDRYATPLALAEDLERWLDDEPISAQVDPLLVRLGRWERRHRTWVATAAALLITATAASSLGALLLGQERSRTQLERDEAKLQHLHAEDNLKRARGAVDRYFTRVSENMLLNEPGLQPLRRELLEDALDYYREFTALGGSAPEQREDLAAGQLRVGEITYQIGRLPDARAALDEARRLYETIVSARPSARRELFRCYRGLGKLDLDLGDREAARAWLDRADELAKALQKERPADKGLRHDRARLLIDRALHEITDNRPLDALASYTEAVNQLQALVDESPENELYQRDLAYARLYRGIRLRELSEDPNFLVDLGRATAALRELEHATAALRELARRRPEVAEYRFRLGYGEFQWATVLRHIGEVEKGPRRDATYARALEHFESGRAILKALVDANPTVHAYREELAGLLNNLGNLLRAMGRREEALDTHREAAVLREAIYEANPEKLQERVAYMASWSAIARLQDQMGRTDDAIATLERIARFYRDLYAADPNDSDARVRIALAIGNIGHIETDRGRYDEAARRYREAIAYTQGTASPMGSPEALRRRLGMYLNALSTALRKAGRRDEAIAAAREARAVGQGDASALAAAAGLLAQCLPPNPAINREALGAEAIATLREAIAAGWSDGPALMRDPALAPIQDWTDFRALAQALLDARFPARPFAR